jgi:hypothetical protein
MGIPWMFEVISWWLSTKSLCWLWYIFDVFNILQGLWIFLAFIAKKNIWQKVLAKYTSPRGGR